MIPQVLLKFSFIYSIINSSCHPIMGNSVNTKKSDLKKESFPFCRVCIALMQFEWVRKVISNLTRRQQVVGPLSLI